MKIKKEDLIIAIIRLSPFPYNAANQFLNRVQVVPLTTSVGKLYPSETYIAFQGKKAKAMADQLTTVSKKRMINQAGSLSQTELEGIKRAIMVQLDL